MKNIICYIFFLGSLSIVSQNTINEDGISLEAYIPEQIETIPAYAKNLLKSKLNQIITKNGIGSGDYESRFIITPNVNVISKNITATAPPMVTLSLEITLYVGDGIEGKLFSSTSIELKGVGTNENKAYISAIKKIESNNPMFQNMLTKSKKRIIEYYNSNCSLITKKANALIAQNKYQEALSALSSVPEVSTCFNMIKNKINSVYIKAINIECTRKLNEASSIWAANQDLNAANDAGAILATIEPEATCFSKIKALYQNIAERVKAKELLDRDWQYKLKELNVEKSRIQAARDIGVAYGLNQPRYYTYRIRNWYY